MILLRSSIQSLTGKLFLFFNRQQGRMFGTGKPEHQTARLEREMQDGRCGSVGREKRTVVAFVRTPSKRRGAVVVSVLRSPRPPATARTTSPTSTATVPADGRQSRSAGTAVLEHRGRTPSCRRADRRRCLPSQQQQPALRSGHTASRSRSVPEHRLPGRFHVPSARHRRQSQRNVDRLPADRDGHRSGRVPVPARSPHRFRFQAVAAAHAARHRSRGAGPQPAPGGPSQLVRTAFGQQQLVAIVRGSRLIVTSAAVVRVFVVGHVAFVRSAAAAASASVSTATAAAAAVFRRRERRLDGQRHQARVAVQFGAVQVRRLLENVLDHFRYDQAPAISLHQRRIALRHQDVLLQVLRQGVQHAWRAQDAHPHAHVAMHMQHVRQGVQPSVAAAGTHPHPHR